MSKIIKITNQLFQVPLTETLVDAKHGDHTHFELVTCTIDLDDDRTGTGYTYTGGKGGHAILAMLEYDLKPFLLGKDPTDVEALYESMQWHVHYVARGGIASFAISAADIALWDLRCKSSGLPLWRMAGGASDRCKAYGGGIDLGFDMDKLLSNMQGYLDQGLNGVKLKVGRPSIAEDIERVAAVRQLIGPERALAADANYSMSVEQAILAARGFEPHNLLWFE